MAVDPFSFTDPNGPDATAADSPDVQNAAIRQRQQAQMDAALQLEQGRAMMEQTKNQQQTAQTGRVLAGQGASSDAAQWADTPAYSGMPYSAAPPEVHQHFMDAWGTLPGGGNGVAEQLPAIWNEAQRNATGRPNIGLENISEGQTAQVKMNGEPITVGKPPKTEIRQDPSTGALIRVDTQTGGAEVIHPTDPALTTPVSPDVAADPLGDLTPSEASVAKGLANYTLPISILSRMQPAQKERLIQHAQALDPNFDVKQYPIREALQKSFTSGPDAGNIASLNTVIGHLGRLSDAAQELHNRSLTPWNYVANAAEGMTGNPAPTKFDQTKAAVASEMAKLFKGTGSPTDSGVREWEKTLSSSASPEQLQTAIQGAVELMQSRADALRQKYENGFQKPNDRAWLGTQAKAVLRKLGVDPGALDPASGAPGTQQAPSTPAGTPSENESAPAQPSAQPEPTIRVQHPDGTVWRLPASQQDAAVKMGGKVIP
jgi:hypothetical protein